MESIKIDLLILATMFKRFKWCSKIIIFQVERALFKSFKFKRLESISTWIKILDFEFRNWELGMLNKVADAGSLVTRVFQLLLQFFQKHLVVRQSVFRSIIAVLGYLYKRNINNTVVTAWNLFDEDGFNLITRLPVTPGDV